MATMTPGDADDLLSVITADHRAVEQIFVELETGAGSPEHRRALADHLTTELVRHTVAEEMFMYPAVRRALPDGDRVADHEIAEHTEVEQTLKELEDVDAIEPRFDELLTKVITGTRHHVAEEEHQILPRLQQACSVDELREFGRLMVRAKDSAPTRPHPSAPDTPPANMILGPGLGMIDRVRDALSGRSH